MSRVKLHSKVDFTNSRESQSWAEEVRKILVPENPHYIGEEGEPAFSTNWGNYTGSSSFFYKHLDRVYLQGLVTYSAGTGNATSIFTLPEGYRPETLQIFGVLRSGLVIARIDIYTTGGVIFYGDASTWASLEGISFRI